MIEAVSTCEMSVNFYRTTRHNIPEDIFKLFSELTSNALPDA